MRKIHYDLSFSKHYGFIIKKVDGEIENPDVDEMWSDLYDDLDGTGEGHASTSNPYDVVCILFRLIDANQLTSWHAENKLAEIFDL